jgi:peroxiredoxin
MKHIDHSSAFKLVAVALLSSWMTMGFAQQSVPSVALIDLAGKTVDTGDVWSEHEGPTLFCFWATWCSPCKRELNNYLELYPDWQEETGVEIVAVSIDDQRSKNRVAPYVNSAMWDYTVLLDPNQDFARSMGVINVPHTFLVNSEGQIIWQHNNYADGDEEEVYEELLKLVE